MPNDLHLLLGVAVLNGSDVGEIVVALRGIVVQPAHDLEHAVRPHVDGGIAPDDFRANVRLSELGGDRFGRRIRGAPLFGEVARSGRWRSVRTRAARKDRGKWRGHRPDRVCCTELPKGSESSSILLAGMYNPLWGSGSISLRIAASDIFSRITFSCSIMMP